VPTPVSEHRITRRVQFHETDTAGLVHFSVFFRYMEEAEHALWRAAGLSIHPQGTQVGWPRRSCGFEFYRALRFEDEFEITMRVTSMEGSTIRYRCLMTKDGERVARGDLAIICVSKRPDEPMKTIPIPEDIAARLRPAAETES
jgi:YbgC/YbaW family acyl-CoA thioester hydrolase